jgi:hypothetical protein
VIYDHSTGAAETGRGKLDGKGTKLTQGEKGPRLRETSLPKQSVLTNKGRGVGCLPCAPYRIVDFIDEVAVAELLCNESSQIESLFDNSASLAITSS